MATCCLAREEAQQENEKLDKKINCKQREGVVQSKPTLMAPEMGTRFREDQLVVDFFSPLHFVFSLIVREIVEDLAEFFSIAVAAGAEFLLYIRMETTRQLMVRWLMLLTING